MNINFNGFGFDLGPTMTFDCELYLGNQLINKQQITANGAMCQMQFLQTVQELAQTHQPYYLKMFRDEVIYDQFEKTSKTLRVGIEYWTNEYPREEKSEDDERP